MDYMFVSGLMFPCTSALGSKEVDPIKTELRVLMLEWWCAFYVDSRLSVHEVEEGRRPNLIADVIMSEITN